MGRARLEPGAVVLIEGIQHRILRKYDNDLWQLEQTRTKRVVEYAQRDLQRRVTDGSLVFETDGLLPTIRPQNFDPADPLLAKAKQRLSYVLVVQGYATTKCVYEPLILEAWRKHGSKGSKPSFTSVYNWVKKYQRSLCDIRSLIDSHGSMGNRAPRFQAEVLDICMDAIEVRYLCRERGTL